MKNVCWSTYHEPLIFSRLKERAPNLYGVLDVKQAVRSGHSYKEYIEDMKGSISHVHLSDIDENGNVYVNGERLDEPYISDKALGECNIDLPYQVPDGRCFVMGDHRATSIDSRNTAVGCVSNDMIIGKILLRVWPLSGLGIVHLRKV